MPGQPQRAAAGAAQPFDGVLSEQHTSGEGAEYVRVTFGMGAGGDAGDVSDPSTVVDAEFLFPTGALRLSFQQAAQLTESARAIPRLTDIDLSLLLFGRLSGPDLANRGWVDGDSFIF